MALITRTSLASTPTLRYPRSRVRRNSNRKSLAWYWLECDWQVIVRVWPVMTFGSSGSSSANSVTKYVTGRLQWRIQKLWMGRGWQKTTYQPHHHLSQMHKTNNMTFYTGKGSLLKKMLNQYGVAAPLPPLNPLLVCYFENITKK